MVKHFIVEKNKRFKIKKIFIIVNSFFLVFISCKATLEKNYVSNCILYGKPEYELRIDESGDFRFISYMGDTVEGKWILTKNKLILKSDSFIKEELFDVVKDSILPNIKYTDFDGYEEYLIKNKKLFFISKNGVEKKCFYR